MCVSWVFLGRGTHVTRDMHFPGRGTHIYRTISFPGRRTHITRDICFLGKGTHITRDMCFLGRGTHITRDMCFPDRGTHIRRDMCFPGRGTHVTRDMCLLGRGTHISREICSRNTYLWHQSEARTAVTIWNWSGKTLSPGALLAVLYFSSCPIFPPFWTFPRPHYLPLGLRGCSQTGEHISLWLCVIMYNCQKSEI